MLASRRSSTVLLDARSIRAAEAVCEFGCLLSAEYVLTYIEMRTCTSVKGAKIIVTVDELPKIPRAPFFVSDLRMPTATPSVADVNAKLMMRNNWKKSSFA